MTHGRNTLFGGIENCDRVFPALLLWQELQREEARRRADEDFFDEFADDFDDLYDADDLD